MPNDNGLEFTGHEKRAKTKNSVLLCSPIFLIGNILNEYSNKLVINTSFN